MLGNVSVKNSWCGVVRVDQELGIWERQLIVKMATYNVQLLTFQKTVCYGLVKKEVKRETWVLELASKLKGKLKAVGALLAVLAAWLAQINR